MTKIETLSDLFEMFPELEPQTPYEWAEWEARNWEEELADLLAQLEEE